MNGTQKIVFRQERDKIFAATQYLIDQGKFDYACLGEIAYYAKLSETTLRVFFRSKEEILLQLSGERDALVG